MKKFLILVFVSCIAASLPAYIKDIGKRAPTTVYLHYAAGGSWLYGDDYPGEGQKGRQTMSAGLTLSFPLDYHVLRLETGIMYETKGVGLTGVLDNHRIELEYLTFHVNLGFEYPSGFHLAMGLYFSSRLSSKELADGVAGSDLDDVIEPGDIGINLKLAYRIHLSDKVFLAPFVRGQLGFFNIYYSDFAQRNLSLRGGMEFGFGL